MATSAAEISKALRRQHKALLFIVVFSAICLTISVLGVVFDSRQINGELAWIKPCKFSMSLTVYGLTMIWFSRFLKSHQRQFEYASIAAAIGTAFELSIIIFQVVRGEQSHFNTSTFMNHALFAATIASIVPVSVGVVVTYALLLRERSMPAPLGSALRWAFFLTIVGFVPAILMVLPDSCQDAITMYREIKGHSVGISAGGPGLPFLGWSTVAGDLRISHFVGIHALQALPLAGWLIVRGFPGLKTCKQHALVWVAGLSYFAVIAILMAQALNAEPLLNPSTSTLKAWVTLLLTSISAVGVVFAYPERRKRPFATLRYQVRETIALQNSDTQPVPAGAVRKLRMRRKSQISI